MKNILIFSVLIFLVGCMDRNEEINEPLNETNTAIPVTIAPVHAVRAPIQLQSTGLIKADSQTKYAFKIGGVIDKIYVDEGDPIKKGQLLASLRLDEINAQVQQANLGLAKAQRDYRRVNQLYQDSIATLEDVQNVKTQQDIALQTVEQLQFNKDFAAIYAKENGFLAHKMSNPGEIAAPGVPVLLANDATQAGGFVLECAVNDRQWAQVNVGDACEVELDAYPDLKFEGKVQSKAVQADPVSGAFRVEVALGKLNVDIATGMYGKVVINTQSTMEYLSVPYEALVKANGTKGYVYTPISEEKVQQIPVLISSIEKDAVFIKSGLEEDQSVILSNSAFLNPFSKIKIIQ